MADFVRSYGLQILQKNGQPFDVSKLTSSDVIAFYFSAHWCPPCRHFTPMLKKFVETLEANREKSLKVIFVSGDKEEHEMWKYMFDCHGDWLALAFSCKEGKERLERQYQVSGIPQLIVIDSVGRSVLRDARGDVMSAVNGSSTQILTTYLSWKSAAGASPSASPSTVLPDGACVLVRGLKGAPENNGMQGTISSYDASKGRYVVELGERSLALRAANLLQLLEVRVRSGESSDEWVDGMISDFHEASGECEIKIGDEKRCLRFGALDGPILKPGARLAVQGLQAESAKQWNECIGEVLEFDEEANRYKVQVSSTQQLKIKPDNLRLFPLP
jgi:nucleoredoxin